MGKLSIEEKAKAYDKALERAQALYNDKNEIGYANAESVLEEVFPLLKESKDEMVRKCLINGMKFYYEDNEEATWGTEKFSMKVKDILAWLEKQGEQKSADEPKFKVGDYVVDNCGYVWKIEGILNQFYILEGIEGGESRPTIEWVNKTFHLWTIQDAKDGDVLAEDTCIFIIKKLNHDLSAGIYCCLFDDGDFDLNGLTLGFDTDSTYPATKEQRDLLFQKMKEAGYEWDAEKKELRKIGQKFDWSEEDERMIDNIIFELEENQENISGVGYKIDWLKSLKERCAWKPSDEQITVLELASKYERVFTPKQIDILIGLKERLKKLTEE